VSAGIEIEVKLAVDDPEAIRRLVEDPRPELLAGFQAAAPPRQVVVVDRYIDTAALALNAVLARARLRHSAGLVTLTFKRSGIQTDGITERVELEGPATAALEPAGWPASSARTALVEIAGDAALIETARLRQHRLVRDLRRDDIAVELSLDHMEALRGDVVVATRWELDAELKEGTREGLADLAAALRRIPGTSPATESKRSFALAAARSER
jgi:inorganic triphosphatase YgiF